MVSKIINNYKSAGKVLKNIRYYLQVTSKDYQIEKDRQYAIINLDKWIMNQSGGRFSYLLCRYLEQAGFEIVLKTNFLYFLVLHPYKALLLKKKFFFVRKMNTPANSIIFRKNGREQTLAIKKGLETIPGKSLTYSLPFPMHPVQVDNYRKEQLVSLRDSKRTIKVFFSGSWTQEQYKKPLERYNVLSRSEVMRFIVERFDTKKFFRSISSSSELNKLLQNEEVREQVIISEVKTRDEDWLKFLSIADFFISPPGFKYPWCHNAIEAMAVGTIPILQYSHLFVPELVHMENCIRYRNLDELQDAISTAMNMEKEDIARMRANVIAYYEQHLSPEAIVKQFKRISTDDVVQLELAMPYINQ